MSSEAVASLAISGQSAILAACFQLTATTILTYEWALCLTQEINLIWPHWRSLSSMLYLTSRYPALLLYWLGLTPVNSVLAKVTFPPLSTTTGKLILELTNSCTVFAWIALVVQCLNLLSLAAFSAMRTYVLARRERWITCLTLALGLLALTGNLVTVFQSDSVKLSSPMHCTTDAPRPPPPLALRIKDSSNAVRHRGDCRHLEEDVQSDSYHARVGAEAYTQLRNARKRILFIVHMLQLTFQLAHITTTESASFVSASVLICHFILSLRAVNEQQDAHMSYTANTELTYPIFTSNVGSSVQYPLTLLSTSAESEHDCTGDI
ncbi:hypothetical protein NUW54_g6255 [Trametes sanguinea]|uniref:Uncharacterized protein n=1 Tax=Trametes sanguinea TaxID=158606 RepID=A0ACC1PW43_9APHY|nr:hypothetical protein NUW54_g6255 [Trametes sanguinea]